jgi:hypothetical protein
VLIARLTAQLRCYTPEPVEETWGRLRHLGARRERLLSDAVAQVQQIRDLLECVWPAALETAAQPFRSQTWAAALWVVTDRDGGDLDRTRRLGWARFERAVRREITKRGGHKPWGALQTNTVYAARYRHLTTRETNKLKPTQAQTVIAAAILRHLHAVITTGRAWDPEIATHGTHRSVVTLAA